MNIRSVIKQSLIAGLFISALIRICCYIVSCWLLDKRLIIIKSND